MKVYDTRKIPVHVRLTELYNDETPDEIEQRKIQHEISLCYGAYTPAQNVFDGKQVTDRIQREIDMSWEHYFAEEGYRNAEQLLSTMDEISWYDCEYMKDYSDEDSEDESFIMEPHKSYSQADRRRMTRKSDKRFLSSVIIALHNLKRYEDDQHSKTVRNRHIVSNPKSQQRKSARLLKIAEKKKLIQTGEHINP